jgi:hypothetical protein
VWRLRQARDDLLHAHREKLSSVGAPGRLLLAWGWPRCGPWTTPRSAAADPRKAVAATLKARDDAIVRNALAGGEPVVVVVLGGGHDLTASVRAADPHWGYIRVATVKVALLMGMERKDRDSPFGMSNSTEMPRPASINVLAGPFSF